MRYSRIGNFGTGAVIFVELWRFTYSDDSDVQLLLRSFRSDEHVRLHRIWLYSVFTSLNLQVNRAALALFSMLVVKNAKSSDSQPFQAVLWVSISENGVIDPSLIRCESPDTFSPFEVNRTILY